MQTIVSPGLVLAAGADRRRHRARTASRAPSRCRARGSAPPHRRRTSSRSVTTANPVNALQGQDGPIPITGTSFAAAYVSGLAALLKQRFPDLTPGADHQPDHRHRAASRRRCRQRRRRRGHRSGRRADVGCPGRPGDGAVQGQADSAAGVRPAARPRPDHRGRRDGCRPGAGPRARRAGTTRVEAPMKKFLGVFGLRFTTGHALWAAVLIPACIAAVPAARPAVGRHHAGRAHRACRGGDDPRPTAHRLGRGAVLVAPAPPHVPDLPSEPAVGATVHAGRPCRGALAGRLPGVGHRAGPPAVHPDGDRQRRGLHRRRRRHPVRRATGDSALPRPGGRRRLGRVPGGQDRAGEPGRALRAGGRPVPGAGQPADLDRAARRPGTDAQVGAASRVRGGGSGPVPGGLGHPHRRSVGQQRD